MTNKINSPAWQNRRPYVAYIAYVAYVAYYVRKKKKKKDRVLLVLLHWRVQCYCAVLQHQLTLQGHLRRVNILGNIAKKHSNCLICALVFGIGIEYSVSVPICVGAEKDA